MRIKNMATAAVMVVVMAIITFTDALDSAAASDRPLQVWLVVDTSPATKDAVDELRAVAQATINSLKAGDKVFVVSAHADRPRLRAITTIGSQETDSIDLSRVINDVKPAILLDADVAEALQVPIHNIRNKVEPAPGSLVLILTDARFHDSQAELVLARIRELEAAGARVYCTGVEGASRRILIAAAQRQVRWSRLTECDPAKWLADARRSAPPATSPASPPAVAQASAVTGEAPPSPGVSETSPPRITAGAADRATPPAPSRAPDQEAPPAPVPSPAGASPSSPRSNAVLGESFDVPVKPTSPQQGPAEAPRSGSASLRPEPLGKTSPGISRASSPAGLGAPDAKADTSKDGSHARPIPPPPNLPSAASPATTPGSKTVPGSRTSKTPPPAQTAPAVPADTTNPQRGASRRSFSPFLYIVVATTLGFGAVLAAVAAAIRKQARKALRKQTRSPEEKSKPDRRELFSVANGQEFVLGPWAEVRSLTFGSGPDATVVLSGDGVLPRHALLTRDGETFWLRNLARQPLVANGTTVAPRRRACVSLPLDLTLTEAVKVALRVRTLEPAPATSAEGGAPHVQTTLEH